MASSCLPSFLVFSTSMLSSRTLATFSLICVWYSKISVSLLLSLIWKISSTFLRLLIYLSISYCIWFLILISLRFSLFLSLSSDSSFCKLLISSCFCLRYSAMKRMQSFNSVEIYTFSCLIDWLIIFLPFLRISSSFCRDSIVPLNRLSYLFPRVLIAC